MRTIEKDSKSLREKLRGPETSVKPVAAQNTFLYTAVVYPGTERMSLTAKLERHIQGSKSAQKVS